MSREVWKVVEAKAEKTGIAKTKRREEEERKEKEAKKEEVEEGRKEKEETKKAENNESKKSGRKIGDLGWREKSSKVRGRSQEISSSKILQMDSYLWKENKWEDANKEAVWSYNRSEERIYAKKGEGISIIKKGERRGT